MLGNVDVELTALERGQRTTALRNRLPRRRLTPRTVLLLAGLRLYVVLAVPLAILAFLRALN